MESRAVVVAVRESWKLKASDHQLLGGTEIAGGI
jgi:hypothetical protein